MKGEYVEEKDHPKDAMFAKLKFQPHQPPPPPHLHRPHFQLPPDESDHHHHHSPATPPTTTTTTTTQTPATASDGATIEVVRRPRGRPPGSKNKPKPPVFITRDPPNPSMSPYFLEIPPNADVVVSVTRFSRKHGTGLCVLSGHGPVANVTLRQPTSPGATVTFHGRFDLLSLSATLLPPNLTTTSPNPNPSNGFAITLSGPQGQVIGGSVVGPLFAAGTVYVVAASFNDPSFHRLPVREEEEVEEGGGGGGGRDEREEVVSPAGSGGGGGESAESRGMLGYSSGCHVGGSDVVWAPTARQPPPPPHYG